MSQITCPKCRRIQYPVCSRLDCKCRINIPGGELPMNDYCVIFRIHTPRSVFNFLWKIFMKLKINVSRFMWELEQCPYCGFIAPVDYWMEIEYQAYLTKGEQDANILGKNKGTGYRQI